MQRDKPLFIHGNGQNTRRYLYAGDAAEAFDIILHRGEIGQKYNVDSHDEISNLDLAKKLLGMLGRHDHERWIEYTRDRPFNDLRYAIDASKLRKLGWEQRTPFEEGLRKTVEWYRDFQGWWGDIEGTLSAFPIVAEEPGLPEALHMIESGIDGGEVSAGALDISPWEDARSKFKHQNGSANGGALDNVQNGNAKKRRVGWEA